jgi:hypothetical protein
MNFFVFANRAGLARKTIPNMWPSYGQRFLKFLCGPGLGGAPNHLQKF